MQATTEHQIQPLRFASTQSFVICIKKSFFSKLLLEDSIKILARKNKSFPAALIGVCRRCNDTLNQTNKYRSSFSLTVYLHLSLSNCSYLSLLLCKHPVSLSLSSFSVQFLCPVSLTIQFLIQFLSHCLSPSLALQL